MPLFTQIATRQMNFGDTDENGNAARPQDLGEYRSLITGFENLNRSRSRRLENNDTDNVSPIVLGASRSGVIIMIKKKSA